MHKYTLTDTHKVVSTPLKLNSFNIPDQTFFLTSLSSSSSSVGQPTIFSNEIAISKKISRWKKCGIAFFVPCHFPERKISSFFVLNFFLQKIEKFVFFFLTVGDELAHIDLSFMLLPEMNIALS